MSETCQTRTKGYPPFYRGSTCSRKVWKEGFCKIHHPESVKAREEKRNKRAEGRHEQWRRESDRKYKRPLEYRDALIAISHGANNAREIATKVLTKWGELDPPNTQAE